MQNTEISSMRAGVDLLDLGRTWKLLSSDEQEAVVFSAEDLDETDLIVVVGPPGMGKSSELTRWHERSQDSGWVDLAMVSGVNAFEEACANHPMVFVDGCDEYSGTAGPLFAALGRIRAQGTAIRISARSSWWEANAHYHGTVAPCSVLELQPLSESGQSALLADATATSEFATLSRSVDESLTRNPRLLLALARSFDLAGSILTTRSAAYEALALAAVEEHNPAVDQIHPYDPSATLAFAEWSAACALLTGRNILTDVLVPRHDERLSLAMLRSSDILAPIRGSLDPRSVLHGHLMIACVGGYRFTDRSMTEYLAASSLARLVRDRSDAGGLWRTLLTIDIAGESFVPPQLRGLAAWAAELDALAFDVVFEADRSVLVENDLAAHNDEGRRRLFRAVLEDDELTRTSEFSPATLKSAYEAADGFAELTRRLDASSSWGTRRRAMEYIRMAGIRGFEGRIVELLLDPDEDALLRYWASLSVSSEFGESLLCRLRRPLLEPERQPDDPENRIRGNLLKVMWPESLSAEQLFSALVPPTSKGLLEYESFLISHLDQYLEADHADLGLRWLGQARPGREWRYRIDQLVSRIAVITDQHLEQVGAAHDGKREHTLRLLGAVGDDYRQLLAHLCPQLSGRDREVVATAIVESAGEADIRAASAVAVCAGTADSRARSDFVAWLYAKARVASAETERIWMRAFHMALNPALDREIVEDLLALTGPAKELFAAIVEPVEIASVPEWQRGPMHGESTIDAAADLPLLDYLTELLAFRISWSDFVFQVHSSTSSHLSLDESGILDNLTQDEWDRLARVAEQHAAAWSPTDSESSGAQIHLSDFAFCDALSLLYRWGKLPPDDPRLLTGQLTLIRCQPGLCRFTEYNEVLGLAHALDPSQFEEHTKQSIKDALVSSGISRFDWLHGYPGGVPRGVIEVVAGLVQTSERSEASRASMLESCVGLHDEVLLSSSAAILSIFEQGESFGTAARALLRAGMPLAEVDLPNLDSRLARQLILALADEKSWPDSTQTIDHTSFSTADLSSLFERSTNLFERFAGADSDHETFEIDQFRRSCLTQLAMRGEKGVAALQALAVEEPLATFIGHDIARVLVEDWWVPFRLDHLIQLVVDARSEVVRSADEMLRAVTKAILAYSDALQSFGGGADLLWADHKPRAETLLSIDLMRYLRMYFSRSSIVLNREVELRPASEHPTIAGERSDLLIEAGHPDGTTISLIVEIKGSWNDEKYTGYERQLVRRYLAHPDADCGLHVVFWFDRASWDESDRRRSRSPKDVDRVLHGLMVKKPQCYKPIDHVVVDASR